MTILFFIQDVCYLLLFGVGVIIHAWFAHGFGTQMLFSMCLQGGIMMAHDFFANYFLSCMWALPSSATSSILAPV